jgi:ribosomal 50S subunit-recycling heat shock protein
LSTVNNLLVQSDNGRGNRFLVSPAFLGGKIMRLDKYLKVSRLIKRRTVANEACDAGRVLVNDKPAKASVQVKTGDTVEIQFGSRNVKVEVLEVKETVKKDEVESMFRYI